MKAIIATSALAFVTLAGAASAMTSSNAAVEDALRLYAPGVEATQVSEADAGIILAVAHSGDSEAEKRSTIGSILR